jgi:heterotetrameric sarcosine oxidase gamma subunit
MGNVALVEELLSVYSVREFRAKPDAVAVSAALAAWQLRSPAKPNALTGDAQRSCAWVEPHAWTVVSAETRAAPPSTPSTLVTDVSDRTAAFRLTGKGARDVIAAACDPQILQPGFGARTRFASIANALLQQWDVDDYRVMVDISIAPVVAAWLRQAIADAN